MIGCDSPSVLVTNVTTAEVNAGVVVLPGPIEDGHAVSAISAGEAPVVICDLNVPDGATVVIVGSDSTPSIDGTWTVTNVNGVSFSIEPDEPVTVTGTTGMVYVPDRVPTKHAITAIHVGCPAVVTIDEEVLPGSQVVITGSNSVPSVDGVWTVNPVSPTAFTINARVLSAGDEGTALVPDPATALKALRVLDFVLTARADDQLKAKKAKADAPEGDPTPIHVLLQDDQNVAVATVLTDDLGTDTPEYPWADGCVLGAMGIPLTPGAGIEIAADGTVTGFDSLDVLISYIDY
jgi:hypothetical protein